VGWSPAPGWAVIGKVERSLAWLLADRRLVACDEGRADILTALLHLDWVLIGAGKLRPRCVTRLAALECPQL
jgi:hypothetical protein